MDQEPRQAFLRVSEIVSIIDEIDGNTTVHMRDGREFCVIASGALECWMHIKDVIDPDLIS
ncbi:hypothetical protein K9B33_21815, partial [Sphingobium sp. 3R8]|uniref:hypothetical protein n=1 Tax=Sphingobium sp. 3R8 TaxID=2874921 RepID=UPI001CCFFD9E